MGGPIHARDESESQVSMIYSPGPFQGALQGSKDADAAYLASHAHPLSALTPSKPSRSPFRRLSTARIAA